MLFLKKLKNEKLNDYGHFVQTLIIEHPFTSVIVGEPLNLENLKNLRVACNGDYSDSVPHVFGMCEKLEEVSWVQPGYHAKCVQPLLQIAPTARCNLSVVPGASPEKVLEMVKAHPRTGFNFICFYDSSKVHDHYKVFGEFCESLAGFPEAAKTITSLTFRIQSSEDVSSFFELGAQSLILLELTVRDVSYHNREFVQNHLAPWLQKCTSAHYVSIVFENMFTQDQYEPWARETCDHWEKQIRQYIPGTAQLDFVVNAQPAPPVFIVGLHYAA